MADLLDSAGEIGVDFGEVTHRLLEVRGVGVEHLLADGLDLELLLVALIGDAGEVRHRFQVESVARFRSVDDDRRDGTLAGQLHPTHEWQRYRSESSPALRDAVIVARMC
ncbi:MAG: hypothetical protein ACHQPH_07310, partial [Reyranellales bacterium]